MLRSASRDAAERGRQERREAAAAATRLALVERLLADVDLEASVRVALEWLAEHAAVAQSACLVIDPRGHQLVPLAMHGAPEGWLSDLPLALAERTHPLVDALWAPSPSGHPLRAYRIAPMGEFYALPLRSRAEASDQAEGLLLVLSEPARLHPNARWVTHVLGDQVHRLRSRETLSDTRFGRERALLLGTIHAVADPILLTDSEGRLIIANGAAERLFTVPDEASQGRRRAVALNNMLFSAALSDNAIAETPRRRELVLADPFEGSDLLLEVMSTSLRDPREGTAIVSVLHNVTELGRASRQIDESYRQLRAAQAEVRDQRRRIELIIDSVADPILVTDPSGGIVLMNAGADRLFRTSGEEAGDVQRRVSTNSARFSSLVSTLLSSDTRSSLRGEMELVVPATGARLPVEAILGTIMSEQGELIWVVTILHDRTQELERAHLYEQLKRASEELEAKVRAATAELAQQNELLRRQRLEVEQASALKSQFLANMSHEFRTPLNAILGYTQMLLQGVAGRLNADQRGTLERIDSNGRHLLALISDILDLSRIEAGRMPLHLARVNLAELIDEVFVELEPLIGRSRSPVSRYISRSVPVIETDRHKVKQILLNLLSNALKFTRRGSVRVIVRYAAARRTVVLTVRDTGIGIPKGDRERIFEDFLQLDSSLSRGHGGTGLGLSICRRLASLLGGRITLASRVGAGAAFTLWLPLRTTSR